MYSDWNPNQHEIIVDKEKYPPIEVTIEPEKEEFNEKSGNALSGVSFRYVFMGAHMAVENSAEEIGTFIME